MHITNQKLSFDIFTVGILQNIFMEHDLYLKGSYDVAKKNIILCIWCNAMCLCGLRLKKHIIFHILYIIVAPLCSAFLKHRNTFLQSSSFWEARRAMIGQLSSALWLAEYLKRETEMLCPLTVLWCRVLARWHKNNKTHYKTRHLLHPVGTFTDYNDLYCLFTI